MNTTRFSYILTITGAGLIRGLSNEDPKQMRVYDHVNNGIIPNKTYKVERVICHKSCSMFGIKKTIVEYHILEEI